MCPFAWCGMTRSTASTPIPSSRAAAAPCANSPGPPTRTAAKSWSNSSVSRLAGRPVRSPRGETEAGGSTDADLAEEIVADPRTGSPVVRPQDDRRGSVSHLHEVHQLPLVLAGALRVEVDRSRLRAHDRDGSRARAPRPAPGRSPARWRTPYRLAAAPCMVQRSRPGPRPGRCSGGIDRAGVVGMPDQIRQVVDLEAWASCNAARSAAPASSGLEWPARGASWRASKSRQMCRARIPSRSATTVPQRDTFTPNRCFTRSE